MPDPSKTFKKAGFWRSFKEAFNEPTGLPGSPGSRQAGRDARALGQAMESNPNQDQKEQTGWFYGWVVEDGRAARLSDPSSRHLNHHQDEFWRWAWDQGWVDQDGWLAAGAGQDRTTNPYDIESDGKAFTFWGKGWERCQEDMKDCRKEGMKARGRSRGFADLMTLPEGNRPRNPMTYPFGHLSASWLQGWIEEDARIAQAEENRRQKENDRVDQQLRLERERREQEARLKQQLAQRIIQLSTPDNDIATDIDEKRKILKDDIDNGKVSCEVVAASDRAFRLDNQNFDMFKKLNNLSRRDGTNSVAEADLIECYLGPSSEHFNQHDLAVRSSLCHIFKRMLDHYPPDVVGETCFPIRTMVGKLFGAR